MKAKVRYDDFTGSAAADISSVDFRENGFSRGVKLSDFAKSNGIDTEKFEPVGVSLYTYYSSTLILKFLCVNKEKSTETSKHFVSIKVKDVALENFFNMFEHVEIQLVSRKEKIDDISISEEISLTNEGD